MITAVDWISFSVPLEPHPDWSERDAMRAAYRWLEIRNRRLPLWLGFDGEFRHSAGRRPYSTSWRWADEGFTLFTHAELPHALVEVEGKGCRRLIDDDNLDDVLRMVTDRLTRLDIACDILTETRPTEFAELRTLGRFKSHSHVVSDRGETYYVGSKHSDRYCRVYRYNEPHERAHLLRVEYCLRAEQARYTALSVLEYGIEAVAKRLGEAFGWRHADWQPDEGPEAELVSWRPERHEGRTVYWLDTTIAPLLVRLHREGVLDAQAWFTEHVMSAIIETQSQ